METSTLTPQILPGSGVRAYGALIPQNLPGRLSTEQVRQPYGNNRGRASPSGASPRLSLGHWDCLDSQYVIKPIPEVIFMKKSSHIANPEIETPVIQQLSDLPKHQFRWSKGVAACSCGYWTLWGACLESAKRSHVYHRRSRSEAESLPVGHVESDAQVSEPAQGGEPEVSQSR